jgi:hypothetical protein
VDVEADAVELEEQEETEAAEREEELAEEPLSMKIFGGVYGGAVREDMGCFAGVAAGALVDCEAVSGCGR